MAEERLTDSNAKLVQAFSVEMANLGFERMAEHITAMLKSGAWQEWRDGLGKVELLPGEFDYFLSMCGVTRDAVMHGVRDVPTKAELEQAMDERRSGEDGYRRRYDAVRSALGSRRKTEPFGLTDAEAKALADAGGAKISKRPALGGGVRRWQITGGKTNRKPSEIGQQQFRVRVSRDDDLAAAIVARLLDEPDLAEAVYRKLHSTVINERQKNRRSTGTS